MRDYMISPANYAAMLLAEFGGDKEPARLAILDELRQQKSNLKHAPTTWVSAVLRAIDNIESF